MHPTHLLLPSLVAALLAACAGSPPAGPTRQPAELPPLPVADHKTRGEATEFESLHLAQPLLLLPGVFPPHEAEQWVLPFMGDHRALFEGKRVFEIGTGSGIIALYAAQLGAAAVVCTDITETAIESVRINAARMGYADVVEPRLVPADDMSAFSTVRDDEVFDVVISNPPYALDLDAAHNTALVDKGDLGFSIVRGLERHLAPDGVATLFYNTLFYHYTMVKFARYEGFEVRTHIPPGMSPWAMEALFNFYLHRLLQSEGLPTSAFRFYKEELPWVTTVFRGELPPLLGAGEKAAKLYPGFMTIRHPR